MLAKPYAYPEYGSSQFLQNVCNLLPNYIVSHVHTVYVYICIYKWLLTCLVRLGWGRLGFARLGLARLG